MTGLLLSLTRMTLPLAVTLAVLPLLRRRSAALRAWVTFSGLAVAAVVPVLELLAPSWGSPISPAGFTGTGTSWGLFAVIWIGGIVAQLLLLGIGMVRLARIAALADPIRDGAWADLSLEIGAEYRVHAPVLLLETADAALPVTWGYAQPKVLLPRAAREWSEERARIVLRHELAHVRRRDWLLQVLATVVRSVYWFHPLVWAACSRLRLECERACDDAVLAGGVSGPGYAGHLVELARELVRVQPPAHAAGLAGRSTLERRVRAMLATGIDRSPLQTWRGAAIAVVMLGLATATAGFGAAVATSADPAPAPPRRLTLLLDGRIMDLSREWPTYPDPRAGLVVGPGLTPAPRP